MEDILYQKNENLFQLNVVKLSHEPRKVVSAAYLLAFKKKVQALGIRWFFPLLNYSLEVKEAPLHNINFRAKSGRLTGVIGSTAERFTLLELLVGRKKSGIVSGNISFTGTVTNSIDYYDNVAYVQRV
jgi:ABC-type polysaccharide/polyol phosphate transport system ATPase subunit